MTRPEFVNRIFSTPCQKCPISIFCKIAPTHSCVETARLYFIKHYPKGGVFHCPAHTDE